ncbi:hypothetical protein [Nocardiopsis sp. B62]|uniref:hypothetical protein n=1 Tax=Nocardiopsis sp. B62 TaxID=2824874 RepID=UPI001B38D87A|nr:hypothetical protein [Nocardiopsis sp. B62]MBQ1083452.1 hypothetical protein [Nocardiopsis sp. B62]
MVDFVGLGQSDALQVGGRELGEEAAALNGQAKQLFDAMESDVRAAMDGGAPGEFMSAHGLLNEKFGGMMLWLDQMGINLSDVNFDIVNTDSETQADFAASGGGFSGLPPINI